MRRLIGAFLHLPMARNDNWTWTKYRSLACSQAAQTVQPGPPAPYNMHHQEVLMMASVAPHIFLLQQQGQVNMTTVKMHLRTIKKKADLSWLCGDALELCASCGHEYMYASR